GAAEEPRPGAGPAGVDVTGPPDEQPAISTATAAAAAGTAYRRRRTGLALLSQVIGFRELASSPRAAWRSPVAVSCLVGLPGTAHAGPGAGALAPVGRKLHNHLVSGHVMPGHHALAGRGFHRLAKLGRAGVQVLVQRGFVLEAAQEPAAGARDSHGVDRQVLVLGHAHRHRLEVLQERRAAQVTPARADPSLQPGLVSRPHLPQLDPPGKAPGQ